MGVLRVQSALRSLQSALFWLKIRLLRAKSGKTGCSAIQRPGLFAFSGNLAGKSSSSSIKKSVLTLAARA
jgi:hypothetical protein